MHSEIWERGTLPSAFGIRDRWKKQKSNHQTCNGIELLEHDTYVNASKVACLHQNPLCKGPQDNKSYVRSLAQCNQQKTRDQFKVTSLSRAWNSPSQKSDRQQGLQATQKTITARKYPNTILGMERDPDSDSELCRIPRNFEIRIPCPILARIYHG